MDCAGRNKVHGMPATTDGRPVPAVGCFEFTLYDEKDVPVLGVVMALDTAARFEHVDVEVNLVLLVDSHAMRRRVLIPPPDASVRPPARARLAWPFLR